MEFEPTAIPDVVLIKPRVFGDARGHFFESWQAHKFRAAGLICTSYRTIRICRRATCCAVCTISSPNPKASWYAS
jgi:hypothetical protein